MEDIFELPSVDELRERSRLARLEVIKKRVNSEIVRDFYERCIYPNAIKGSNMIALVDSEIKYFEREPNLKEYLRLQGYRIEACCDPMSGEVCYYKIYW